MDGLKHLMASYDLWLALMAAATCFGGMATAFHLFSRMRVSRGLKSWGAWSLLGGMVAGGSVWATHLVATLAFAQHLQAGYGALGVLAALVSAVVMMGAAFGVAGLGDSWPHKVIGGLLAGLGAGASHYLCMAAFAIQGTMSWSPPLVGASLILGVAGAIAAMFATERARTPRRQVIGSAILSLSILALHFIGMAAITLTPDPTAHVPAHLLSSGMLGLAVVMVLGLVVAGGLGAVLIEGGVSQSALDRIRRLADAAYEGIVVVRGNSIQDANAAFCALAEAPLEALSARAFEGELVSFDAETAHGYESRREGWLRPQGGGRPIPVEVFGRILEAEADGGPSGDLVVLALRDLRERRSAEEKIRFLAEHDGLTGLSNRNAMQTRLAALIARTEASGENLALIYVDLDHFKEANDLHGHLAGDAILVEVARRLKATVAAPSFAARLGGDEFVIAQILPGPQAIAAAADFATHLSAVLAEPVVFEGQTLAIGASLGVSLYPDDGRTPEALMVNADMALYRAKAAGRGGHAFFKREMDETVRERRNLTRELRSAVADGQLVVHYQPLARVDDNEVLGFEALVRWNHPERGMIPPLDFIPLAEENGLIVPLGEWVLRQACADAAAWERPLRIAVNLSPLQLHQANLPNVVHEVLIETGLAPDRLELEITETALYKDYQRALDNLRRLKAIGVRIAMDDFGTGFSSLATLHSFPFDKLKIDRSFIENMNRHERATVIVRAVLGLGRSLNIPVTAEGVETFDQLEFLRDEACAEVQGYCIGRPTPLENLFVWTAAAAARMPRIPLRSVKR